MPRVDVIISIGIPGSGKSTWATKMVEESSPWWIKTARDDFRYSMQNKGFCDPQVENLITKCQDFLITEAVKRGNSVIIDNTNVKAQYINYWIKLLAPFDHVNLYYKKFPISMNLAISRDSLRERKVGIEVIERMYEAYENLELTYDFSKLKSWDDV